MKYLITIVSLSVLFLSCNKKVQSDTEQKKEFKTIVEFRDMPDSLILNKTYYSRLYYKSVLDSIKLRKNDNRYIFLYVTTEEGTFKEVEEIKQVEHRIFLLNDSINTFEFEFEIKNTRFNTIKAIIEDMVILDNYYKDGKARIITNLHQIEFDCKIYQPQKHLL